MKNQDLDNVKLFIVANKVDLCEFSKIPNDNDIIELF
jgi:hypothetical protein